jgi:exopolysaccharide production protein ExoY
MHLSPKAQGSFAQPPAINGGPIDNAFKPGIPALKLIFDKVFAVCALILISPAFFLLCLAIWAEGRGPVIFRHKRIGKDGRTFECLKFRTMDGNSEDRLAQVLAIDPIAKKEWDQSQKLFRDPRVSRLGAFLRKSSLDELPQFWNILVGDMSVVGPRPIINDEVHHYGSDFSVYTSVRPGLTGAWQIGGRSETSYEERVALDVNYVREWGILKDARIVAKTVKIVLLGQGAY